MATVESSIWTWPAEGDLDLGDLPAFYRRWAQAYDWWSGPFQFLRRRVVALLDPTPGDVVVDVACGTGLCFELLEKAVGPGGRVIGIDESPEMLDEARRRVARHGWQNVTLVEAPAHRAEIPVAADAALFCAAHDILRTPEALRHVLAGLRPGARVAATGGQWAPPWWPGLNLAVWWLHVPFVRSFEGFDRPWDDLAGALMAVRLDEVLGGTAYLLVGTVPSTRLRYTPTGVPIRLVPTEVP